MNKFLNPRRYARRALRAINNHLFSHTEAILSQNSTIPIDRPPIFILGAPRSGSTLAFQLISDAFDIGYISNRHSQWYGSPALAEKLFRPTSNRPRSNYRSNHGDTSGAHAPSECGAWWYRFFRQHPAYVTLPEVNENKMKAFRRSLSAFGQASERPLLFKNLYSSLRLEPMAKYVPEAIYIVIERDWVDNAQSILNGRMDALGRYDQWWSVPPPEVEELIKLPPEQQAVRQIASIYQLIKNDINRLNISERTFRIRYETLCDDVHGTLDRFQSFMKELGVELQRRFDVPTKFNINHRINIPESMHKRVIAEVRDYNKKRGEQIESENN